MQQRLDAIWAKSRPDITARVEAIENTALALLDGTLDDDLRRLAHREAHKLAGTCGTFGFSQATDIAREAEDILESSHEITSADIMRLSAIAVSLRHDLLDSERPGAGSMLTSRTLK